MQSILKKLPKTFNFDFGNRMNIFQSFWRGRVYGYNYKYNSQTDIPYLSAKDKLRIFENSPKHDQEKF